MRVFRVSRIQSLEMTQEYFDRPAEFDLAAFWATWSAEFEASRRRYLVKLRVLTDYIPILAQVLGDWVQELVKEADPPRCRGMDNIINAVRGLAGGPFEAAWFWYKC